MSLIDLEVSKQAVLRVILGFWVLENCTVRVGLPSSQICSTVHQE